MDSDEECEVIKKLAKRDRGRRKGVSQGGMTFTNPSDVRRSQESNVSGKIKVKKKVTLKKKE